MAAVGVDRRPTAFVVDLGGGGGGSVVESAAVCETRRRLPLDPLSRYVPPSVERSSARRRADLIRKKLQRRQVRQVKVICQKPHRSRKGNRK